MGSDGKGALRTDPSCAGGGAGRTPCLSQRSTFWIHGGAKMVEHNYMLLDALLHLNGRGTLSRSIVYFDLQTPPEQGEGPTSAEVLTENYTISCKNCYSIWRYISGHLY
jgi:hypothetical protein